MTVLGIIIASTKDDWVDWQFYFPRILKIYQNFEFSLTINVFVIQNLNQKVYAISIKCHPSVNWFCERNTFHILKQGNYTRGPQDVLHRALPDRCYGPAFWNIFRAQRNFLLIPWMVKLFGLFLNCFPQQNYFFLFFYLYIIFIYTISLHTFENLEMSHKIRKLK